MSNHLAVAAVTATLVDVLRSAVQNDVTGAEIKPSRPENGGDDGDSPEVRVFLYRVEPNAAWRNDDLPMRTNDGSTMINRPQAALTLNYLFAFSGDEAKLEPQRLLGSVVRRLHARPILKRDDVQRMISGLPLDNPPHPLSLTDLADQPEEVRFTPLNLDLDALSNLWSAFFQAPYLLSVAYEASVVLLSPDENAQPSLPVRERHLYVNPIRRPHITRVVADSGARVIGSGDDVRIEGSQLTGETTIVWFGGIPVTLPRGTSGDESLVVTVPTDVPAGVIGVRLEHRMTMGKPPEARTNALSNNIPMTLRPRIRQDNAGAYLIAFLQSQGGLPASIDLTVDPAVGKKQHVMLHLSESDPPADQVPHSYSLTAPSRDHEDAPDATHDLSVPVIGVRAGTYLVRVQVDAAESTLVLATGDPDTSQYDNPRVVIA